MVRAKFYCSEKLQTGWDDNGTPKVNAGIRYTFKAVYSNKPDHPNKAFFEATPDANLMMYVTNPAGQIFELGKVYTVDFNEDE